MANDINKEDPHYKGEYGSIYEVNRKFPTGGVAGDFVVIEGWAHYWNADRGTWCVNAERDNYWDELITNIIEKFKLVRGATYMGVASLDTVPAKAIGAKMYYFATVAGTYKNFGDLVVPQGINVLYSENGSSWVNTTLLEVAQELGVSTNKVVSQKALNDALNLKANQSYVNEALAKKADKEEMNRLLSTKANTSDVDTKFTEEKNRVDGELGKKFDKESIVQESGESEDKVMSQKAIKEEFNKISNDLDFTTKITYTAFYLRASKKDTTLTTTSNFYTTPISLSKVKKIIIKDNNTSSTVNRQTYIRLYKDEGKTELVYTHDYRHNYLKDIEIDLSEYPDANYAVIGFFDYQELALKDVTFIYTDFATFLENNNDLKKSVIEELYDEKEIEVYPTFFQNSIRIVNKKASIPSGDGIENNGQAGSKLIDLKNTTSIDAYLAFHANSAVLMFWDKDLTIVKYYNRDDLETVDGNNRKKIGIEVPKFAKYLSFVSLYSAANDGYTKVVLHRNTYSNKSYGSTCQYIEYEVDCTYEDYENSSSEDKELTPANITTDEASIVLPMNYDPLSDKKYKLIISCHGASNTQINAQTKISALAGNDFVIAEFTGVPKAKRNAEFSPIGVSMANELSLRCAKSLYNYCVEHYNINPSEVYLFGESMGGLLALNIALSGILPIKAIALDAPVIDLYHDAYFSGKWFSESISPLSNPVMVAYNYNWDGIDWTNKTYTLDKGATNKPLSDLKNSGSDMEALWELNKNKMIGFNAYLTGNFPIKAIDGNYVYETNKGGATETTVLTDNSDLYYGKKLPCPLKIWMANIDSVNQLDIAKRFVQICKNGGSIALLRTIQIASHGTSFKDYVKKEMHNWFSRF